MDLKGAFLRNFYDVTKGMNDQGDSFRPLKIKIPHYQRPYKWGKTEIEKIINDWFEEHVKDNGVNTYFSGSIVSVSNKDYHDLVDGQQRFTTLYIINFVRFLLLRVAIRQEIGKNKTRLRSHVEKLNKTIRHLFFDAHKLEQQNIALCEKIENHIDNDEANDCNKTCDELLRTIGLPVGVVEDDVSYQENHFKTLNDLIQKETLSLQYDRGSFGAAMANVFSRSIIYLSDQNYPKIVTSETEDKTEIQYAEGIKASFDFFSSITEGSNPYLKSLNIEKRISSFIHDLTVCVVQTGRPQDAYTLFEVMNDRSLSLDDLDLIKNQFFRAFVTKNPNLNNDEFDALFDELDERWTSRIFTNQLSGPAKKLICYLATVFITGSHQIKSEKTSECRQAIVSYHDGLRSYSSDEIHRDFNIFLACKVFVESVGLRFRQQDSYALKSEYNDNSQFKKTATLTHALGQPGVMAGLVCYTLNSIKQESSSFDYTHVTKAFNDLANSNNNKKIAKQSYTIWALSLLSKNYELPKDLSNDLIKENNLQSTSIKEVNKEIDSAKIKSLFQEWIDKWSYTQKDIRVRVLFSVLLKMKIKDDELFKPSFTTSLKEELVEQLQMDHLEPQKIQHDRADEYFDDIDRAYYVNGLGNMMPLPNTQNAEKGNKPIPNAFKFMADAGLDDSVLLAKITKELFYKHSVDCKPKREFFTERKKWLTENFYNSIILMAPTD